MRAAIEGRLGDLPISDVLPSERIERAQGRRQKDGLSVTGALTGLLPYLDFSDSYEALMSQKKELPRDLLESLSTIALRLPRLIAIRNRVAHIRPMEIDDSSQLLDAAKELLGYSADNWPTLAETLTRLSDDPSYVLGLSIDLPTDPDAAPQHNLPIPDFDETGFFGRQDQLRRIKKAIKGAYPVVSILGDGGIGKTSIALKAAYELLEDPDLQFDTFVWVTAKATILTTTEIHRINGAIESSLGLFAQAALELGSRGDAEDPMAEVLAYLENFNVLLILDNLETVLDTRLREFLLDLPLGSKVIVTSRIGLGIENPIQLAALSLDDSARLLRALARIRDVSQLRNLPQDMIELLARKMSGHPAYIRWFVAGVQSGRRPEELVEDNALLLDFCMSNVYEYLQEDARSALRSMQVLPGARNQAELAFLNDYSARQIQSALLELIRTNFVYMTSQSSGETLDTVYQISEFGKQYLDNWHPVEPEERDWLLDRNRELLDLGLEFTAASYTTPYSTETVNVRGPGDFHVARLLRDAIRQAAIDPAAALALCAEAQVLAPSYYESWRVEAYVRSINRDYAAAIAAYDRALELASDSAVLHFHYGSFLLDEAGEPARGLEVLQRGARLDENSAAITGQIAWAHYCLGHMLESVQTCKHVLTMKNSSQRQRRAVVDIAFRSATTGVVMYLDASYHDVCAELLELTVEFAEEARATFLTGEATDRLLQLQAQAATLAEVADDYAASKAKEYRARLAERQRRADPDSIGRRIGELKTLKSEKGFGFIRSQQEEYFFHYRDLIDLADWEKLVEGVTCAFEPRPEQAPRHARAIRIRVLD